MSETTTHPQEKTRKKRSLWFGLFIILALIVGLIVLNLLYEPALGWRKARSAPPGELMYISTFDGFEDEWQEYEGRLSADIDNSKMTIHINDTFGMPYSLALPDFENFDVQVTTEVVDGPIDNGFGLIFRLNESENDCDFGAIMLCDMADLVPAFDILFSLINRVSDDDQDTTEFFAFLVSSDGYYRVTQFANGTENVVSNWIPSPLIHQGIGETNTLRVIARGNQFQFFINDESVELCIPNDPNAQSTYYNGECIEGEMQSIVGLDATPFGKIGVVAQATQSGGPGVVVEFDDLIIRSPQPEAEGDNRA